MSYVRSSVVLAVLLALGVIGCDGGSSSETKREVGVTLVEWRADASVEEVKQGMVTITATNNGTIPHELVVVKTDFPPELIDLVDHKVDESKMRIAGRMDAVVPGSTATMELNVSPGKFVLLCNIVERVPGGPVVSHYENGMYASLLVTQ